MEFKQGDGLEKLARDATRQISEKRYYTGLSGEVLLMGIAHRVKECAIETAVIEV